MGKLDRRRRYMTTCAAVMVLLASPPSSAGEHTIRAVTIRGYDSMFFEPDFLRALPGDTVRFVVDDADHQPRSVFVPGGAEGWEAEPGQAITVTLTREGVYIFDCVFHNVMGMAGVIVVGSPVNAAGARKFFEDYRASTFAMNEDRLEHVWDPDGGLLTRSEN